ncbi:MAG TPA: hypothetical protein VHT53_06720 [Candidatus Elarobacter sp.]|jgi:hypothetical protein|nr:hypothetical protein [Candidatus Elarobacter sp.]
MESLATVEHVVALIGGAVVFVFAIIGLRGEWHKNGLDDNVTKVLLGLMAFGCILVALACFGVLPRGGAA